MPIPDIATIATIKNEVVVPTGPTGYITIHDYVNLNGCYVSPTKPILEKN
jgi:hypothetical protein